MLDTFMLINSSMQSNRINQFSIFVSVQLYQKKNRFYFFCFHNHQIERSVCSIETETTKHQFHVRKLFRC